MRSRVLAPLAAALVGIVAGAASLAAAEIVAAFVRPVSSPVVAVGGAAVDSTPEWLKEFAIRQFGTNDKPVLIGAILVVLVLLSLVTGALAVRRRSIGLAGVAVLGLVGAAAAATRPAAEPLDPFPSLLGAVVGLREYRIISEQARNLLGTIYLPAGRLIIDSKKPIADQSAYTVIIARLVNLYDGPDLVLNARYGATDIPVPNGVGPSSADTLLLR